MENFKAMNRTIIVSKRKWWLISLSFIICHLSFCPAGAQTTFTQRIQQDTKYGGKLTVTHSKVIDSLVNGRSSEGRQTRLDGRVVTDESKANGRSSGVEQKEAKPVTTSTQQKQTAEKPVVNATLKQEEAKLQTPPATISHRTDPVITDTAILLPPSEPKKKVMVGSYKVNGYRVQAFAGGNQRKDRLKAEQTAAKIKANFPDEPVYTHFYSPRWICRVGNYRTLEEANEMLIAIRKLGYPSATIVKGKITVQKTE